MLWPLEMLEPEKTELEFQGETLMVSLSATPSAETLVARAICMEAHDVHIPLCAEVVQSMYGPPNVVVRHYDYGKDLSHCERQLIDRHVNVAADKQGLSVLHTLHPLRYAFKKR